MKRKILGNILASFLIPVLLSVRWFPSIYKGVFHGVYEYYDVQVDTFGELLMNIYGGANYFLGAVLGGLIILLPFQLIKNGYYRSGKHLSFTKKWMILSSIFLGLIILFGTFSNIWWIPYWKNIYYILFSLGFGLIIAGLLYLCVDRYVERQPEKGK